MLRVLSGVTIAMVLFVHSALASDDRDGGWWSNQTQHEKIMYVTGFFDGIDYGGRIWDGAIAFSDPVFDPGRSAHYAKIEETANGQINRDFSHVTAGQLVAGLDTIYKDFRNTRVLVIDAMTVVVRSMGGSSDADVERILEHDREDAAKKR